MDISTYVIDLLILFIKVNKILNLDSYGQQKKPDTEVTKENRVQEPSMVAHAVIPHTPGG